MKIRIGTRGSDLALWQANFTKTRLEKLGAEVEIIIIKTQGDKIQHLSFDKMEGKGFFTKEIEDFLLNKKVDLAVHSHKDLETTEPEGLKVIAVSHREDPSELLLMHPSAFDASQKFGIKANAILGTSSARRKCLIGSFRSDIQLKDLRGNVPTRINKLRNGDYDGILLAKAGVSRLGLDVSDLHFEVLDYNEFIPAPAQGVLAWQTRENDTELNKFLSQLNDDHVAKTTFVERSILKKCNGGCQLPLGVYCELTEGVYHLKVSYAPSLEQQMIHFSLKDSSPEALINKALEKIQSAQKKK